MGSGAGCLPHLRCGRLPAGWTERHLPALRLGDLHSVDWQSGRLQSHRCAVALGWRRLGDRYFVVDTSREGDSSVAALWFVPFTRATNNFMFLRLVADSFGRRPRHKLLTGAALALGMGVATAALSVSLDVGDRLAKEFRSLGANLIVTPQADSLPLEIGGVDYRPVNAGAYLPESDLPKLKTIFWHNNIVGFAPILEVPIKTAILPKPISSGFVPSLSATLIGTWSQHSIWTPDLQTRFVTGIEKTNPWWTVEGRWFSEDAAECVVGASFARKTGRKIGDAILVGDSDNRQILGVVGILSTGGPEDDAIVAPIAIAQNISAKPGAYRRLYVSALTKPEDAFAKRDPKTFTPKEYDTWFCTPYISSIAFQIQQELPGR